ncbi:D-alanine--D-alanine ligase [Brevundimonas sp. S30B]|uniref:D-alanine--D-alanine ligase n=1 Tax=unclassified Brevundimonas TaxID=2622653 RepID=UPI001071886D|nr:MULTISPECIES: D-alanine--D-alanine ligase [unclassified Brevundimonas]QBX38612.1 D-alanine--D-alanine ligase [Brevundimonas sp. MF30-B]TFW01203.1 D-alanine--D-alanine ligase [Brevundimonas sp. S30B]
MSRYPANAHVAVLLGGLSSEREVSLSSGRECADALQACGYRVTRVDAGRDLAQVLAELKPDVVFNALHGDWGEDGCVQGVLETLNIPYTHSGVLASALTMDKDKCKSVLRSAGVPVPGGGLFDRREVARRHVIDPPYVIKPNAEGSSVGVYLVREGDAPSAAPGADDWTYGEQVMVEPFVAGKELCVTVLGEADGPRALTVTDITPTKGFYDYEAKYAPGGSVHQLPAALPPAVFERCLRLAEQAHVALGCRGVTRSDYRYDDVKDVLVLLEVNTQPGMTPTSLVPEQAAHVGLGFQDLVRWMVEDASCPR